MGRGIVSFETKYCAMGSFELEGYLETNEIFKAFDRVADNSQIKLYLRRTVLFFSDHFFQFVLKHILCTMDAQENKNCVHKK